MNSVFHRLSQLSIPQQRMGGYILSAYCASHQSNLLKVSSNNRNTLSQNRFHTSSFSSFSSSSNVASPPSPIGATSSDNAIPLVKEKGGEIPFHSRHILVVTSMPHDQWPSHESSTPSSETFQTLKSIQLIQLASTQLKAKLKANFQASIERSGTTAPPKPSVKYTLAELNTSHPQTLLVRTNKTDSPSNDAPQSLVLHDGDMIVFPEGFILRPQTTQHSSFEVQRFAQIVNQLSFESQEQLEDSLAAFDHLLDIHRLWTPSPTATSTVTTPLIAMVCVHGQRDMRCQTRGNILLKQLDQLNTAAHTSVNNSTSSASPSASVSASASASSSCTSCSCTSDDTTNSAFSTQTLSSSDISLPSNLTITTFGCSHVGGHVHAANLICFTPTTVPTTSSSSPSTSLFEACWFGRVPLLTTDGVNRSLKHLISFAARVDLAKDIEQFIRFYHLRSLWTGAKQ